MVKYNGAKLSYRKQIDRALEEAIKIRNPTSMYLRRLIKVLIFNDYSLNEWTKVLLKNGVFKNRIDSVVFFTYVDFDLFNKAKGLLKVSPVVIGLMLVI